MSEKITRRKFALESLGLAGSLGLLKNLHPPPSTLPAGRPILIADHTNETGQKAVAAGLKLLQDGGTALDAVERAANVIEKDPNDYSVGLGGLPNEEGVVQLDASIMDGKTYNAGAVACLENIVHASSVARVVMEQTDHVLLVGRGALEFARKWGFKEQNLLTEKSRQMWLDWKRQLNPDDDWGPPDHLRDNPSLSAPGAFPSTHGTTNLLAVDRRGDIAGITSTSGLSWKISGRVGDSPIIGAGLYVDNEIGAAGATGRGEDVIKSCASYYIVLRMGQGRSPQQACEDALRMIIGKYRKVNPAFFPEEKLIAINKKGEFGCAFMKGDKPPRMTIGNPGGIRLYTGSVVYEQR